MLRYRAVLPLLALLFLLHPIHYDFHIPRSHETLSGKQSCNWRPLLHNNLTTSRSRSRQCLSCLSQLLFLSTCFRPFPHNVSIIVVVFALLELLPSHCLSALALSIYVFFQWLDALDAADRALPHLPPASRSTGVEHHIFDDLPLRTDVFRRFFSLAKAVALVELVTIVGTQPSYDH